MKKLFTVLFALLFAASLFAQCDPILNPCLPVTITSFDAKMVNGSVTLNWATASEVNAANFEIERSVNGKEFGKIATVKCENKPSSYQLVDDSPLSMGGYYRLTQVDYDGRKEVFKAIFVEYTSTKIEIYPNPSSGAVTVAAKGTIKIFDVTGRQIKTIDASSSFDLPKGFYIVKSAGEARQLVVQ